MEIKITGLEVITEMLDQIKAKVDNIKQPDIDRWLDNDEFISYLRVSKKTAQHYRDSGIIEYSQVGAKLYYKLSEVNDFLERYKVKRFQSSSQLPNTRKK